ncbi:MAG: hypothetical protein K9H49_09635 [Bacteroidales bacterium]|nr:hypothetical protein [Bacteroidales bacterium]MCF8389916.1 hypothetical protein [Bacteroidales bacterium]
MKKTILLIVLISLVLISHAQTAKIAGSWLMIKAEVNGEVQEPNFITDLKENGDMVIMDMEAGTWKYDKQNNSIVMVSELDKDFNGENKILNLTENEMVLLKGDAKLFYTRVDMEQILKDNSSSGLEGSWKTKGEDGLLSVLKFKLPDEFMIVTVGEGYTETSNGTWSYDAKNKNLRIVCGGTEIDGTNKLVNISAEELELENSGNIILAKKEKESLVKIERLEFSEDDFYTEDGNYKYEDESKLPWQDPYAKITSLLDVHQLLYNYSTLIEGTESFDSKILRANVYANEEEQSLSIDNIFYGFDSNNLPDDTELPVNYEYTSPLFPMVDEIFRVSGSEKLTTPAGTFECTIIEQMVDYDLRKKFWMINDKPGIYAKIIEDEPGDWGHYCIYELQGIE